MRKRKASPAKVVEAEVVVDEDVPETLPARQRSKNLARSIARGSGDLLESFLRSKAEHSAKNYRIDLQHFARWLGASSVAMALEDLFDLTGPEAHALLLNFKSHLKGGDGGRRYAASTINRRLAAIKSICLAAQMAGKIDWQLKVSGEKSRAFKDTTGVGFDGFRTLVETQRSEIEQLRAQGGGRYLPTRVRDFALLNLMYYAGMRRAEPLSARYPSGFRIRRMREDGQRLEIPELYILGKKRYGEYEWAPVGGARPAGDGGWPAVAALEDWIAIRGSKDGWLFPGRSEDKPLTTRQVNHMLDRLGERAGLDVTPHKLRHTAITEVLERLNGNLPVAQRFARHADPSMTGVYDDNRRKRAAHGVGALEDE